MMGVFAKRGEDVLLLALQLNAQHHDDVGAGDRIFDGREGFDPHPFDAARHHGGGSGHDHTGAHPGKAVNVGPCDAAVQNIADDRDFQPGNPAFLLPDRHHVQKRL